MSNARALDRLEAANNVAQTGDLADQLERARLGRHEWRPPFTEVELEALAARDDLLGRIARGIQRAEPIARSKGRPSLIAPPVARRLPAVDAESLLVELNGVLTHRPHEWVYFAFEDIALRAWQAELLEDIGTALEDQDLVGIHDAIRRAIGSGHSAGKTGLGSMLPLWAMSTAPDTRVLVLSNTEQQTVQRNFADLQRFYRSSITSHWFTMTSTALFSADSARAKTWHAAAATWSESRVEGIQGLHQGGGGRRILILTDECSAHPPALWQSLSGVLVDRDVEIIWVATGNPTRSQGPFYDALMAPDSPWHPRSIDTRTIPELNQSQIEKLVIEYGGEDSDLTRVRIRGLPPQAGDMAFFNRAEVEAAMKCPVIQSDRSHPMVIGVDVARRGTDTSVLTFRHNLDARTYPPLKLRTPDLMALAARVAAEANQFRAIGLHVVIMADGTGLGAGVVDRLRSLGYDVVDVQFAGSSSDPMMYANLRAGMHGDLRAWIRKGGALPNDPRLLEQMAAIEYGHNGSGQILLEPKDDLRRRLGHSPDELDSICCSLASPVSLVAEDPRYAEHRARQREAQRNFDPYAGMERSHDPYGADR